MAKQTFTTGQILTAAQMNSLQQTAMGGGSATAKTASYTLVAADAGTTIIMNSASATTITVNTGLFADGDTVMIQNIGAGVCTVTAGTATVNTAGSLALSQYEGGTLYFVSTGVANFLDYVQAGSSGAWTLISSGSLSGNVYTVSSIPSTYKDIRFVMKNGSASGGGVLFLRLNGDTGTNYYYSTNNSSQTWSYVNGNSNVQGVSDYSGIPAGDGVIFEVYEYAATNIRKLFNEWHWNRTNYDAKIGGYNSASAITSLSVQPQSSNWSAGTWELWGIK